MMADGGSKQLSNLTKVPCSPLIGSEVAEVASRPDLCDPRIPAFF